MTNLVDLTTQSTAFGIPLIPLLKDSFYGLIGLTAVLIFHGAFINHITMRFEISTDSFIRASKYNRVFFRFYLAFLFIALIHVAEIFIWAAYLIKLDLIHDPIGSLLFAGSCYTTIGFVADILPFGWKSLAFFIALSGLFSIAWTTSIMVGMTNTYKIAWKLKYKYYDPKNS
ncbi:hypothetical protein DCO17_06460 [Polynucleobacter tropicus]|uniref:Potassium channel domain-containing protein n=1 Tax=Polynucleobacter tropicus TaxID=1743174 RepID=A0A6M9PX96_9BURK|nr:hypothetical protein [Polynucleobacter tropicus]QKM64901.1 hypothetical protein DCO17_06460 [Polynucleobacter tropicus]